MKFFRFFFVFLSFLSFTSAAIEVDGLYSSTIYVTDQSSSARELAAKKCFVDILIKATGDSFVGRRPEVIKAKYDAHKLINSFRYNGPYENGEKSSWQLVLNFDPKAINSFLQENKIPFWSSDRPEVIAWIAVEKGNDRKVISSDNKSEIKRTFDDAAFRRGIPLIFPMMDVDDLRKISISDIWAGFDDELKKASARYSVNHIFSARIYRQNNGKWIAKWHLRGLSIDSNWSDNNSNFSSLINAGIDTAADIMSKKYALSSEIDNSNRIKIAITGIDSMRKYISIQKYLGKMISVKSLFITYADNNTMVFSIDVDGDSELFFGSVNSGDVLIQTEATEENTPSADRYYKAL